MWLIVDDERTCGCDVIARTPDGARTILGGVGYAFEGLCLDHDLGFAETGYDILLWAFESDTLPPKVQLVTMNPCGMKRMADALEDFGYVLADGVYIHAGKLETWKRREAMLAELKEKS